MSVAPYTAFLAQPALAEVPSDTFGVVFMVVQPLQGRHRPVRASHDVMAEFSKWPEAGEESIFSLETEKNLPGASDELRQAAARTKKFPEIKLSQN